MRKREIRAWIKKHRQSLVGRPTSLDFPRAGDVEFDRKAREYRRWQEEWEYDQQCCRELGIKT